MESIRSSVCCGKAGARKSEDQRIGSLSWSAGGAYLRTRAASVQMVPGVKLFQSLSLIAGRVSSCCCRLSGIIAVHVPEVNSDHEGAARNGISR
jgi:hypothetical protein